MKGNSSGHSPDDYTCLFHAQIGLIHNSSCFLFSLDFQNGGREQLHSDLWRKTLGNIVWSPEWWSQGTTGWFKNNTLQTLTVYELLKYFGMVILYFLLRVQFIYFWLLKQTCVDRSYFISFPGDSLTDFLF